MQNTEVLIVGAGPTGLVLALWLVRQGVRVRIIDRNDGPGPSSRAMAVQARTLELYRQIGIADAVVAAGHRNPAANLWARGRRRARIVFGQAGAELTPYPFVLIYPQDHHERLLVDRLAREGVTVERGTELLGFDNEADRVVARLRLPDGTEDQAVAQHLAGCDGARSTVRHLVGARFEGGTYDQLFYVADVEASGEAANGELHVAFEGSDFVALFPYGRTGQARLVGTVRDAREGAERTLAFEDVSHSAIDSLGLRVDTVNWFSTYRVHHRVADRYRHGRAFLVGDAAHVHSPVGGQGMNTGIGDAINLAWKLAAVLQSRAPDGLLDSYETERIAFARTLVATTDRGFTVVSSRGAIANVVRTVVAPLFASAGLRVGALREFLFRVVSQTMIHYHGSPLSEGSAGSVRGGDRLPWVTVHGVDNYRPLSAIAWQAHVYGDASPPLREWCASHGLPLHEFSWDRAHGRAGLAQGAVYLLRPDTYVALADPTGSAAAILDYFRRQGIRVPDDSSPM